MYNTTNTQNNTHDEKSMYNATNNKSIGSYDPINQ